MMYIFALTLAITPILLGGFTFSWRKNPPKDINGIYGYRTRRSMRSQESWDCAHHLCGNLFPRYCLIMLLVSELILFMGNAFWANAVWLVGEILLFTQIFGILLMIIPVEKKLKSKFG